MHIGILTQSISDHYLSLEIPHGRGFDGGNLLCLFIFPMLWSTAVIFFLA